LESTAPAKFFSLGIWQLVQSWQDVGNNQHLKEYLVFTGILAWTRVSFLFNDANMTGFWG